jgi:hypothetical protein
MKTKNLIPLFALGLLSTLNPRLSAAPLGTAFTFQGYLNDGGQPANGLYDLRLAVFDTVQDGTGVGGVVNHVATPVTNGLFTGALDFGSGVFTGDARWLEIGVRTHGAGDFTTLTPRQPLTPVPYAMFASSAGTATSVPWTALTGVPIGFTDGVDNDTLYSAGLGLNLGSGNLFSVSFAGSGTSVSAARGDHDHFGQSWNAAQARGLSVTTTLAAGVGVAGLLGRQGTGAGSSFNIPIGVWGDSGDGIGALGSTMLVNGAGVQGWHFPTLGSGSGVHGLSASANGRGVRGAAYSLTGTNYGVYGESSSPDGFGGYFVNANGGSDTAVRALAANGTVADLHPSGQYHSAAGEFVGRVGLIGAATENSASGYGVVGITPGANGIGVWGHARATNGVCYGLYGRSDSTSGRGVYGYAKASSGAAYGVFGESDSTSGRGVYGHATANSGVNHGVYGLADSGDGFGIYGRSAGTSGSVLTTGAGVVGESSTNAGVVGLSDEGPGVRGSSASGNGVYAFSSAGTALRAQSSSGHLIEAYSSAVVPANRRFYVSNAGNVYADGTFNPGGADVAEGLPGEGNTGDYEPGDVLEISTGTDLRVRKSSAPYSPLVAGVRATQPGMLLSERGARAAGTDDLVPVGVIGILPTKVSGENGPIAKGDLLVSSSIPGHAMKGTDRERMLGATLGKALQDFSGPGAGRIKVLVNLR